MKPGDLVELNTRLLGDEVPCWSGVNENDFWEFRCHVPNGTLALIIIGVNNKRYDSYDNYALCYTRGEELFWVHKRFIHGVMER